MTILPAFAAGGVQLNSNVAEPWVPNRVPCDVCSIYCRSVPLEHEKSLVAHSTCVNLSEPGVKLPACAAGSVVLAVNWNPQRCCAGSCTVTFRCCANPGI